MFRAIILIAAIFAFAPGLASAAVGRADTCIEMEPDARFAEAMMGRGERRVALVIGNGDYSSISRLPNPPNDASAVAERLQKVGFRVFLLLDGADGTVASCLAAAGPWYEGADIGVLYYAGHGIQVNDENFVIGVNAPADLDAARGLVPVTTLIESIRRAKVALVFLDACRTNPFDEFAPSGLAVADARIVPIVKPGELDTSEGSQPTGMMIAYATSPNAVALDGSGDHSPFTQAFLDAIGRPGHSLQQSLSEIGRLVGEATDFTQTPWSRSSLTSLLYINGTVESSEVATTSIAMLSKAYQLSLAGDKREAIIEALKAFPATLDKDTYPIFEQANGYLGTIIGTDYIKVEEAVPGLKVNSVAASLDGKRFALLLEDAADDGKPAELQIWDRERRVKISGGEEFSAEIIGTFYFTQDSAKLVAADRNKDVFIWDALTGKRLKKIIDPAGPSRKEGRNAQVESVSLNGDATLITAISHAADFMRVTEIETGRVLVSVLDEDLGNPSGRADEYNKYSSRSAIVDNNRAVLLTLVGSACEDGIEYLRYDLISGQLDRRVAAKVGPLQNCTLWPLSLSADGEVALIKIEVSGTDGELLVVDTATGEIIHRWVPRHESAHILTPDGSAIYIPSVYNTTGARMLVPIGPKVPLETEGLIAQEMAATVVPDGMFFGIGYPLNVPRWYYFPPGFARVGALIAQLSDSDRQEVEDGRLRWFPLWKEELADLP